MSRNNLIKTGLDIKGDLNFDGSIFQKGVEFNPDGGISWSSPVDANIEPSTSGTYDLGTTSKSFGTTYTDNLDLSYGDITTDNGLKALIGLKFGNTRINTGAYVGDLNDSLIGANVFVGLYAGNNIESTGLGAENPTGFGNTIIGCFSGEDLTTGENNTVYGSQAGVKLGGAIGNTLIGNAAGAAATGSRNVMIGQNSGIYHTSESDKLWIDSTGLDEENSLIYGEFDNKLLKLNSKTTFASRTRDNGINFGIRNFGYSGMIIDENGKFVYGGNIRNVNDTYTPSSVVRINIDGSQDSTFICGFNDEDVLSIAEQLDGKLIVGTEDGVYRLNTDGSLDTTFNNGGFGFTSCDRVNDIIVQSDQKIIISGKFIGWNGSSGENIFRLNTDGSLDTTFVTGTGLTGGEVHHMEQLSNSDVIIAGEFDTYNSISVPCIIKVSSNGSLAGSFNYSGAFSHIHSFAINSSNKILVVEDSDSTINQVELLLSSGIIDTGFSSGTGFYANTSGGVNDYHGAWHVAINNANEFVVFGTFERYNSDSSIISLVKLSESGDAIPFSSGGPNFSNSTWYALGILIDSNDNIYLSAAAISSVQTGFMGLDKPKYVPLDHNNVTSGYPSEIIMVKSDGIVIEDYTSYFEDDTFYTRNIKTLEFTLDASSASYIGDADTDGSWRYMISGDNLVYQRRESGVWETKQTILATPIQT